MARTNRRSQWLTLFLVAIGFSGMQVANLFSSPSVPEATDGFQLPMVNDHYGYHFLDDEDGVPHPGADYNGPGGGDSDLDTPIYAVARGVVVGVDTSGWGSIVIEHNYKGEIVYSQYGHMGPGRVLVSVGDVVKKGQQIGRMGGQKTKFAHLHWEIRKSNHLDPTSPSYWPSFVKAYTTESQKKNRIREIYYNPESWVNNAASYTISAPPSTGGNPPSSTSCPPVTPHLSIDGTSSSTRSQGDTFTFSGSGFTCGGTVEVYLLRPTDQPKQGTWLSPKQADQSGNVQWTFPSDCTTGVGTYKIWAYDDGTKQYTQPVQETVSQSNSCSTITPPTTSPPVAHMTVFGTIRNGPPSFEIHEGGTGTITAESLQTPMIFGFWSMRAPGYPDTQDSEGAIIKTEWFIDGTFKSDEANHSFFFPQDIGPGQHTIQLRVTDTHGQVADASAIVIVNLQSTTPPPPSSPGPVVHLTISADSILTTPIRQLLLIHEGQTGTVIVSPDEEPVDIEFIGAQDPSVPGSRDSEGQITARQWFLDGAQVANTINYGFMFPRDPVGGIIPSIGAGQHTVTLRVTDNQGRTAEASATFTIIVQGATTPPPLQYNTNSFGDPLVTVGLTTPISVAAGEPFAVTTTITAKVDLRMAAIRIDISSHFTLVSGSLFGGPWWSLTAGQVVTNTVTLVATAPGTWAVDYVSREEPATEGLGRGLSSANTILVTSGGPQAMSVSAIQFHPTGSRSIQFILAITGRGIESTSLQVFNLQGQVVFDSGFHWGANLYWTALDTSGRPLANGVYLYLVTVRGYDGRVIQSEVRKVVVMR